MKIGTYLLAVAGTTIFAGLAVSPAVATTYQQSVEAANPLAYFRLTNPAAGSTNGLYTTTYQGSVTTGTGAPLVSDPTNTGAVFDGVNSGNPGMISTSLSGNIPGAGTILAWINLAQLPSVAGNIQYIAGESQYGNDFDVQFEGNNVLRFYTGSGQNTAFTPDPTSLVGQWHLIAATYDGTLGNNSFRNIYWDGAIGSTYTGSVNGAPKISPFTIGYSPLFGGREFFGSIDEVAVFGRALSASDIASIYASRLNGNPVGQVPEPASWAMMIIGFGMIGAGLRVRQRHNLMRRI